MKVLVCLCVLQWIFTTSCFHQSFKQNTNLDNYWIVYGKVQNTSDTNLQQQYLQGYVTLNMKVFENIDTNGSPINEYQGEEMIFRGVSRTMYIWKHYLIDVNITSVYENGVFTGISDTIGYTFYDLAQQEFLQFDSLSTNAIKRKRGKNNGKDGSFTRSVEVDPMNGISDSTWIRKDTNIEERKNTLIEFLLFFEEDTAVVRRTKFWIDESVLNFPLQLSYLLSSKNNDGFVYKAQQAMPDEKAVMVTSLDYLPAKLPDYLLDIFNEWAKKIREK